MRYLLLMTILISPLTWASDASDWKPLDQVLTEFQSSNDPSTFSYLIGRCAGLFLSVAKSSQSRAESSGVAAQYIDAASKLMNVFSVANLHIKGLEPSAENREKQLATDTETIKDFSNGYMDRINFNYTTTGHHLAKDPFMRQEMMTCKPVAESVLQ